MDNLKEKPLAIIGFMATGKSTLGPALAQKLGYAFVDTDQMVEESSGLTVSEIFEKFGEQFFRELEHKALKKAITLKKTVIATGGGIILLKKNRMLLSENTFIVTLSCSPATIYARIKEDSSRPLLKSEDPLKKIQSLLSARQAYYDQCHFKLSSENQTSEDSCQQIIHAYKKAGFFHG